MKYCIMILLIFLVGCSGCENEKIETDKAKENNLLLIPPCLK